jgi:hypothetical protein
MRDDGGLLADIGQSAARRSVPDQATANSQKPEQFSGVKIVLQTWNGSLI